MDLDELGVGVAGAGLEAAGSTALPLQAIELVERPKIAPQPPLAMITASAGKARISMVTRSCPTQPRQRPWSSRIGPRKSQNSYFVDLAGDFPAADLLVQGVEQLLAGGGPGEGGRW